MNTHKFTNLLCFIALGAIATAILVKYLGVKLFGIGGEFASIMTKIAYYFGLIATALSAYSYAKSRRNNLYIALFVLFLAVIVVFSFVL